MKYKIGILVETLSSGGAERSAGILSKIFSHLNHKVFVILLNNNIVYPYKGKLIVLEKKKEHSNSIFKKFKKYRNLKQVIDDNNFDFVLDFRMKKSVLREVLLNMFVFKDNVINMVRSFRVDWYLTNNKMVSKWLYSKYLSINTVSQEIKKKIEYEFGFKNVNFIPNPIDISFVQNKAKESIEVIDRYILFVGRLSSVKQVVQLVEVYANSKLPKFNIKLYILGEGEEKESIINEITNLNLVDKVNLIPYNNNPFKYMKNAKFLILSSKYEGFPRVLIESLASGTPVVSFNCESGPNEIINHENNGLLVENQNFEALNLAMNRMVDDETLYFRCKNEALKSVEKYSLQTISEQWQKYLAVLKKN
ncbi:glycosyltransferase [Aestuariibaculum sediminum]|uniref:Glycosyltransferase n=1 Tax=Aestuariibaculum sediminum TaxID=2770637 RepID=A0A8J6Q6B3_9FLAO|nr:glycosyltransferase [Aestuariibaculum sediminum]MBD0830555.1 glycosyltransferase [Aestuariibaculum sediminum]